MPIDYGPIEEKWRRKWERSKVFESDPDESKLRFFLTVAYPYPNSPQHIGHGRTYTLADAHARYKRMRGFNVLFPMAFHYTGTPILAISRRIKEGDQELIETFRSVYGVSEESIREFHEPLNIARYFHNEIREGMKAIGYSIDWRREFTTIDPTYSKFIEWQFAKLRMKGFITKGSHPVGWCPKDGNPVGQHDTLGDVEPEIGEYTIIRFLLHDLKIPTATLRPETIFGVTNLWINPDIEYVKVDLTGEKWLLSKEAVSKLRYLGRNPVEEGFVKGSQLIGQHAKNSVTGSELILLPASFVDPKNGTGIVMSVPAHAPYDQQALEDLKSDPTKLNQFNLNLSAVRKIEAITIIESEGYGDNPALQLISKMRIKSQNDPKLEDATSQLYAHEFHVGRMMKNTGSYAGLSVVEAREAVRNDLVKKGDADSIYEIMNRPVVCRCGTECVVKIFENQWFINYGDRSWKTMARQCMEGIGLLPEDIRAEFRNTIDWLKEKACARKSGLGTKLPWDQSWVIESLSDSVIYMAYYLIARHVKSIDPKLLTEEVFDYVMLGLGDADHASKSGISKSVLEAMKRELDYYYPLDIRHSGRDLVPNHLTFFVFNHVAIFPKEKWPKQIAVNGSVLMEGKKMSKSFGNIIPLRQAIGKYGADPLRLTILGTAELLQDADISLEHVKTLNERLERIVSSAEQLKGIEFQSDLPFRAADKWLLSRLQGIIEKATEAMNKLRVREALQSIIYSLDQDILWYVRRTMGDTSTEGVRLRNQTLLRALDARVRMLAPFAPHVSEEIWEMLGKEGFVSLAKWPEVDENLVDKRAEGSENFVVGVWEDLQNILKVAKITPSKVVFYVSASWKWKAYLKLLGIQAKNVSDIMRSMKSLLDDADLKRRAVDVSKFLEKISQEILNMAPEVKRRRTEMGIVDELAILRDAQGFFSRELDAEVMVYAEDDPGKVDSANRASLARPYRPAIYLSE